MGSLEIARAMFEQLIAQDVALVFCPRRRQSFWVDVESSYYKGLDSSNPHKDAILKEITV